MRKPPLKTLGPRLLRELRKAQLAPCAVRKVVRPCPFPLPLPALFRSCRSAKLRGMTEEKDGRMPRELASC